MAYQANIEAHPENRQLLSDGCYIYFGFRLAPGTICGGGCTTEDPRLIGKRCAGQPCVLERGIENCAQGNKYVCAKLIERLVEREEVQILDEDYERFVRSYENARRPVAMRSSLQGASQWRAAGRGRDRWNG